ncbi:MAG: phenylalanine--tRNA ligase subunit beta [Peptococcaceae bacterium]|nr:phenylalanine--tRNA ligase subunit beta [Peptococcaceae bacterium]
MLISYKWLKDYVDIDLSPAEFAEKMTMAGIIIEHIEYPSDGIEQVVVGEILSVEAHPQADKLKVLQVNVGDKVLQIATGAPNVAVGQKVPVALPGAKLPSGKEIQAADFRGVASCGMLCSADELNIDHSEEGKAGIMILPSDVAVGKDIIEVLGLDDAIMDMELTPNRSDCMSVWNTAKEAAAVLGVKARDIDISFTENKEDIKDYVTISVEDPDLCKRYTAKLVKNVKIGPSPLWMQEYLRCCGMRPINNIVDIANFVMLELGQPLHTFDYQTLAGKQIIVRRAKQGEKIITLDDQERTCHRDNLLICDGERPVCIAGVMGGQNTEVTERTTDILIEAAHFDPVSVRKTSREVGVRSESSARFEKGVDLQRLPAAANRCAQLLAKYCGGEIVGGFYDSNPAELLQTKVLLRPARINQILGTDFSVDDILSTMERLDFPYVEVADGYEVTVPFYRQDVTREEDLAEEVARLLGYDKIPVTLPQGKTTEGKLTPWQKFVDDVLDTSVALGLREIKTYDFISPKEWDRLLLPEDSFYRNVVKIQNPLNEEQSIMRTTLVPGVLNIAALNHSRSNSNVNLFECGATFIPTGEQLPREPMMFTGLVMGKTAEGWQEKAVVKDYFYLKGMVEQFFAYWGITDWQVAASDKYAFMHPGQCAEIFIAGELVGFMGQVHPLVAKNYQLPQAFLFELDLTIIFRHLPIAFAYHPFSKHPAMVRDLALIVDNKITASQVEAVIWAHGGEYLRQVALFDVYAGSQLAEGTHSLAYTLSFQAIDKTLVDQQVNDSVASILSALEAELGVKLRY